MVTVTNDGATIAVESPYNAGFVAQAKSVGGKWDGQAWRFDPRDEARVRALLKDIYGTDGSDADQPGVTVRIDLAELCGYFGASENTIVVAGHPIVSRRRRDQAVRLEPGVVVVAGEFTPSGGSAKSPAVGKVEGVVLEWRDVARGTARLAVEQHPGVSYLDTNPATAALRRGWWTLTYDGVPDLTDDDRAHIADAIRGGMREGEIIQHTETGDPS